MDQVGKGIKKMIELLAGDGISRAFKALGIDAKRTYKRKRIPNDGRYHGESFEIWEISENDHEKICAISDDDWKDTWGFWRSAIGSNMGTPYVEYIVADHSMIAWDGLKRERLQDDWENEPQYEKDAYEGGYAEYEELNYPRKYKDLLEYLCEELGASTERNICALSMDLAKENTLTMGELFTKYLP
jgi:hypothetical protein